MRALISVYDKTDVSPFARGLTELGFELVANTPEQFEKFQKAEFDRWKQLIEARNITAN
mgnify:CR=1 FL=1